MPPTICRREVLENANHEHFFKSMESNKFLVYFSIIFRICSSLYSEQSLIHIFRTSLSVRAGSGQSGSKAREENRAKNRFRADVTGSALNLDLGASRIRSPYLSSANQVASTRIAPYLPIHLAYVRSRTRIYKSQLVMTDVSVPGEASASKKTAKLEWRPNFEARPRRNLPTEYTYVLPGTDAMRAIPILDRWVAIFGPSYQKRRYVRSLKTRRSTRFLTG
ncbi:unnamed protein product, partial [Trichogramma brassicae]